MKFEQLSVSKNIVQENLLIVGTWGITLARNIQKMPLQVGWISSK